MRQLYLLLKTRFIDTWGINKLRKTNKVRLILYAFLAVYVIASLLITSFGYANTAADYLNKYHMISLMLVLFFIGSAFSTFMFSIYNAKSSMFSSNDNDLLLSMPIKPKTILASRLIYITIWNLLVSFFIMLPAFIVYAMKVNVSFVYYILALIVFFLLPFIPTILASIIGYIIAYFTSKSNAKNWFEIVMSFLFIGGIYYGMSKANDILSYMVTNVDNFQTILKWCFYPVYLVNEIFNDYNYISLFIFIVLNVGLFILFTIVLSTNFKKIIAKLQENKAKSNFVMKKLKTNSIAKVLYFKELKRYLSSPIYVLNTSFGVILMFVMAIASIFYSKDQIISALNMGVNSSGIFQLLIAGVIFIAFISSTTSASISLEGRNFWILKTLPLNPSKVFNGKILLSLSLTLPAVYLSLLILKFTFALRISEVLILIILATLSALVSAMFGLLVNLKFPKMDAINDVVIVKRSASVMICILVPMAIIFGIGSLYSTVSNSLDFNALIAIVVVVLLILSIVQNYLLQTWGIRRFKEIN